MPSTIKALKKAGLDITDIGLFEVNEAFAIQVLSFLGARERVVRCHDTS